MIPLVNLLSFGFWKKLKTQKKTSRNYLTFKYQAGVVEPRVHLVPTLCPPFAYPMQSSPVPTLYPPFTHPVPTLCPPCAYPVPTLCPPMSSTYRRPSQVLSIYKRSENSSMTLSEYNLIHVVHETIKLLKYLRKKIAHVSS